MRGTGGQRVDLIELSPDVLHALAAGDLVAAQLLAPIPLPGSFIEPGSLRVWRRRSGQVEADPHASGWITRAVFDPIRRVTVGRAGFHAPPDAAGMVEVGYAIDPPYRRTGYARAALAALLDRANREPGVRTVRASIRPDNVASRRLVEQYGFRETGQQWDEEDGLETIFELDAGHRPRVAVLDDYQHAALASADFGPLFERAEVVPFHDHLADESDLVGRLAGFDVVIVMRERTPFPRSLLERLPALKLLVTTGSGNASIDIEAAKSLGVTVSHTGYSSIAAAEMTWAVLMALVRRIPAEDAAVRSGQWQTGVGRQLSGSALGLLGLGRIGRMVARFGQAFGMDVIAWSQNLTAEQAAESGVQAVSRTELFERADIVSIHVRQSPRTIGIVGADELRRLGPDGLLVNTSRGPVVDEAALITALQEGWIGGAAVDVFDVEPLPADHPLRHAPNTVITPHVGYVTREMYSIFYRDAVENVVQWLSGTTIRAL